MDSIPISLNLKSLQGSLIEVSGPDKAGEYYGRISCKGFVLPNVNVANFAKIIYDLRSRSIENEESGWIEDTDCTLKVKPGKLGEEILLQIFYGDFVVYENMASQNDIEHDFDHLKVFLEM
jgi:hypothetical protein